MEKQTKLSGLNVVYFEARHAKALGDLLSLQGAKAYSAPAMKEVPLEDNVEALAFAEKLFSQEIDLLVLLTGVGTKALMAVLEPKYGKEKILDAFRKTTIIPRGPKPIRVLNEWNVPFAVTVPEPNTWKELLKAMDDNLSAIGAGVGNRHACSLQGKTVAIQEYGVSNPKLILGLEERGARVLRVPVYRWALPDDTGPLEAEIQEMVAGHRQMVVFTTAVQAEHLFQIARKKGLEAPLKAAMGKMVVASVGPDCSVALRGHGLRVDIQPESPKMGPLVVECAQKAKAVLQGLR
jgi:uroporphyrinogen-III synthase